MSTFFDTFPAISLGECELLYPPSPSHLLEQLDCILDMPESPKSLSSGGNIGEEREIVGRESMGYRADDPLNRLFQAGGEDGAGGEGIGGVIQGRGVQGRGIQGRGIQPQTQTETETQTEIQTQIHKKEEEEGGWRPLLPNPQPFPPVPFHQLGSGSLPFRPPDPLTWGDPPFAFNLHHSTSISPGLLGKREKPHTTRITSITQKPINTTLTFNIPNIHYITPQHIPNMNNQNNQNAKNNTTTTRTTKNMKIGPPKHITGITGMDNEQLGGMNVDTVINTSQQANSGGLVKKEEHTLHTESRERENRENINTINTQSINTPNIISTLHNAHNNIISTHNIQTTEEKTSCQHSTQRKLTHFFPLTRIPRHPIIKPIFQIIKRNNPLFNQREMANDSRASTRLRMKEIQEKITRQKKLKRNIQPIFYIIKPKKED